MSEEKKTLFDLVAQTNSITQTLIERGGELDADLEKIFDEVNLQLADKVDSYAGVMERMDTEASYWKAKADMYSKIAKAHAAVKDRLKDRIKSAMTAMGKDEVLGNDIRFKLAKAQPALIIEDSVLPAEFKMVVTTHVPDKERIKEALKEGFSVPGARLENSFSLRQYANKR